MKKIFFSGLCIMLAIALVVGLRANVTGQDLVPKKTYTILIEISNADLGFHNLEQAIEQYKSYLDKIGKDKATTTDVTTYAGAGGSKEDGTQGGGYRGFEADEKWYNKVLNTIETIGVTIVAIFGFIGTFVVDLITNIITILNIVMGLITGVKAPDDYAPIWERLPDLHKYATN